MVNGIDHMGQDMSISFTLFEVSRKMNPAAINMTMAALNMILTVAFITLNYGYD